MSIAVEFRNVSKRFTLHRDRPRSLRDAFFQLVQGRWHQSHEILWALRDISFAAEGNTTLGLIGPNGSGKSTVLKLAGGILEPTEGDIRTEGRVSALIELGAGFHPELTGRENVYLNGAILGLSRREIKSRFAAIVAFSELEGFIDVPVKYYSSGMYMRLGFAIAIHVEPEILLIDEILAVGDRAFQGKCLDRIRKLQAQGVAIVFVSHNLDQVRQLCSNAIWLDEGRICAEGTTEQVIDAYLGGVQRGEEARLRREEEEAEVDQGQRWGSGEVEITRVELLDRRGEERRLLETGETMIVRMHYLAHKRVEHPVFGLAIYRNDGLHINGPNTQFADCEIEAVEGQGRIEYRIEALPLMTGTYELSAAIYDETCTHPYDHQHRMYTFRIEQRKVRERYGAFYIPARWRLLDGST